MKAIFKIVVPRDGKVPRKVIEGDMGITWAGDDPTLPMVVVSLMKHFGEQHPQIHLVRRMKIEIGFEGGEG